MWQNPWRKPVYSHNKVKLNLCCRDDDGKSEWLSQLKLEQVDTQLLPPAPCLQRKAFLVKKKAYLTNHCTKMVSIETQGNFTIMNALLETAKVESAYEDWVQLRFKHRTQEQFGGKGFSNLWSEGIRSRQINAYDSMAYQALQETCMVFNNGRQERLKGAHLHVARLFHPYITRQKSFKDGHRFWEEAFWWHCVGNGHPVALCALSNPIDTSAKIAMVCVPAGAMPWQYSLDMFTNLWFTSAKLGSLSMISVKIWSAALNIVGIASRALAAPCCVDTLSCIMSNWHPWFMSPAPPPLLRAW